jgi:hypothetical protein
MSKNLTRILKLLAYLRPEAMTPGAMVVATIAVDAQSNREQLLGRRR